MDLEKLPSNQISTAETPSPTSYPYQPLAQFEIRLLVVAPGTDVDPLQCRLIHVSLDTKPKYEALSYAWGESAHRVAVSCDGKPILVTFSLCSALEHLRHEQEERIIWADAICINQNDLTERSQQVAIMGDIYAQTERVLVWLGVETEDAKDTVSKFNSMHEYFLEHEEGYPDSPDRWGHYPSGDSANFLQLHRTEKDWQPQLAALARRPWFVRRWVIQEVAKAPSAVVYIGKKQLAWAVIANVMWSIHKAGVLTSFASIENPAGVLQAFHSIFLIELARRDILNGKGGDLLPFVISARLGQSVDPRDVFFALLGVVGDLESYNANPLEDTESNAEEIHSTYKMIPDYELTTEEVYTRFVITNIIKKKSLLPLSAAYIRPEVPEFELPSWVPDFYRLDVANPLMYLRNESALPYHASGQTQLRATFSENYKVLHLFGKIVDTIDQIALGLDQVLLSANTDTSESPTNDRDLSAMQTWLQATQEIAMQGVATELSPTRFDEYVRTLVFNLTSAGDLPPPNLTESYQLYLDLLSNPKDFYLKYAVDRTMPKSLIDSIQSVESSIALRVSGWLLCNTGKGRLGRVLYSARKGDLVVVCYGAEVPYVLRPNGDGSFEFIGSCYMHGLMNGEGLLEEGLEEQEFALR